ncbi:hypothetical protein F52700_3208 [Fusarium sp. NRRL 52700]|nr:hypothetical protein F52700_3208 [Fusarium sp. NRRL 52700]
MVKVTKVKGDSPLTQVPNQIRNHGHIPDGFNSDDKPYYFDNQKKIVKSDFDGIQMLWDSNRTFSNFEPIYDQHQTYSCAANATAAAIRYTVWKAQAEDPEGTNPNIQDPSRLFIYYLARAYDRMENDSMGYSKWPTAYGIAVDQKWPWKDEHGAVVGINDRPFDTAFINDAYTSGIEYLRLDPDHPYAVIASMGDAEKNAIGIITLFRLRLCIYEGYPVVFGFRLPTTNSQPQGSLATVHVKVSDMYPTLIGGPDRVNQDAGHTVLAIGYDHANKRVLVQNSYGLSENPRFWIPYEWITTFSATQDFWTVRIKKPSPSQSVTKPSRQPSELGLGLGWAAVTIPSDIPQISQAHEASIATCIYSNGVDFWYASETRKPEKNDPQGSRVHSDLVCLSWLNLGSKPPTLTMQKLTIEGAPVSGIVAGTVFRDYQVEQTNLHGAAIYWVANDGSLKQSNYGYTFDSSFKVSSPSLKADE